VVRAAAVAAERPRIYVAMTSERMNRDVGMQQEGGCMRDYRTPAGPVEELAACSAPRSDCLNRRDCTWMRGEEESTLRAVPPPGASYPSNVPGFRA